ncbi:MAG: 3-oxoadipyl-CoA thiolase [Dinoroseobacter sp.]|nr:3-oxoadipyl-CoA thiolase [Dinoroseobacter sp.]MDJ0992076.1 3-oxoadipyl-CoA thiolase [Dinoroseobacter sp.]
MRDVFICDYIRTPIGRYGGALAQVRADDLAAHAIRSLAERMPGIATAGVDEVVFGCANQAGEDNRNVARMATLLAGLPETVPALTVNRLCASGLDAVAAATRQIACGEAEIVIAGGVESMSRAPLVMPKPEAAFSRRAEVFDTTIGWRFINPQLAAEYGTDSMPETAENVASDHAIARADQDAFALRSQKKALAAQENGRLAAEIAPVSIPQRKGEPVVVSEDEHPRLTTTEKLASLPTPFREGGTVTAGNASGVNDGAAALVLASRVEAQRRRLRPLAKVLGAMSAGVAPRVMGVGPIPASNALCRRLGLTLDDFDVIELNEAFAAQALAVLRGLDFADDDPRVNPNGGAIALGHPLGMSGARLAGTAALELSLRGSGRALVTMCVGVGQGVAMALEAT